MDQKWVMEIRLLGPRGENYRQAVPADFLDTGEFVPLQPLSEYVPGLLPFDAAVQVLKRRQFRKDMFMQAATHIGAQLAERMEDAEGWHDTSRVEPAKRSLAGLTKP